MISALILTSILSLGSGLTLLHSATAAPSNLPQEAVAEMVKGKDYASKPNDRANRLPRQLANAVRQDLSRKIRIPASKLRITEFGRKLGQMVAWDPRPDEFCTRALVEGWRITLSDGRLNLGLSHR